MSGAEPRRRQKPLRYGENAEGELSSIPDENEEFSDDGSLYEPEQDGAISRTSETSERSEQNDSVDSVVNINFDDDCEDVRSLNPRNSDTTPNIEKPNTNSAFIEQVIAGTIPTQPETPGFHRKVLDQLQLITDNQTQILVRISVIEKSLLKNGVLDSVNKYMLEKKPFEIFNSFVQIQKLPLKSVADVTNFVASLNETTMEEAITALSNIPGLNGGAMMGNKPKMIKTVVYALIDQSCLAQYSWSGKGLNGRLTKNAIKQHPKLLELIHVVVRGADVSYDYQLFLKQFKEKVMKYAYGHGKKSAAVEPTRADEQNAPAGTPVTNQISASPLSNHESNEPAATLSSVRDSSRPSSRNEIEIMSNRPQTLAAEFISASLSRYSIGGNATKARTNANSTSPLHGTHQLNSVVHPKPNEIPTYALMNYGLVPQPNENAYVPFDKFHRLNYSVIPNPSEISGASLSNYGFVRAHPIDNYDYQNSIKRRKTNEAL